jgi:hypothetical protein
MAGNVRIQERTQGEKEAAILALLTARRVEEAARRVGIAPRTLFSMAQEAWF